MCKYIENKNNFFYLTCAGGNSIRSLICRSVVSLVLFEELILFGKILSVWCILTTCPCKKYNV